MEYITVRSLGGSIWSFRKDRIELVCKRTNFKLDEINNIPDLKGRESCAIIRLIGSAGDYYCDDSYESIMEQIIKQ